MQKELKKPKIVVPACTAGEIARLAEAGADEIYCGLNTEEWQSKIGSLASANQRPPSVGQVKNLHELKMMSKEAQQAGIIINLVLNKAVYSDEQEKAVFSLADMVCNATHIDNVIVAAPSLVKSLSKAGLSVHVSNLAAIENSEAAGFYSDLGSKRVILPDNIHDDEIEQIIANNPQLETECFVLSTGCLHIQGLCGIDHDLDGLKDDVNALKKTPVLAESFWLFRHAATQQAQRLGIRLPARATRICLPCRPQFFNVIEGKSCIDKESLAKLKATLESGEIRGSTCSLCRIFEWTRLGVAAFKIVSRDTPLRIRLRNTRLASKLRDAAQEESELDAFMDRARKAYRSEFIAVCPEECPGLCGFKHNY